jgi:uncharacterized protein involved in outer membrane biogenesis
MISISRYQSQITRLMAASLGKPVRLSSVEMRLLPRPGFVLSDLTVEDDPAYGNEPVLHANTVVASIRLLPLWRGRLEIGSVKVDEASLNLVRASAGNWNLDSIFRTATAQNSAAGGARKNVSLPFLEATNSRINIKNGTEKLPFSLLSAKVSLWQEKPGEWRIQMRGEPVRTDVNLNEGDTGEMRIDVSLHRAAELHEMPVQLDVDWKDAQLGQLSRLLHGSDSGWRGDMTGELHLNGTADAAQVTARLRASNVHRAEFAPAAPLDFDARCSMVYHFTTRSTEKLSCDSPLGTGHIRLAGDLPSKSGQRNLSVALDKVPVAATLDALRTVRDDFGPGVTASGTISGTLNYSKTLSDSNESDAASTGAASLTNSAGAAQSKTDRDQAHASASPTLTGGLTVDQFQLSGGMLSTPIQIAKIQVVPVAATPQNSPSGAKSKSKQKVKPAPQPQTQPAPLALTTTVALAAGGTTPLTITSRLARAGYQLTLHGQASVARARELAHVAGLKHASLLDNLAGDPLTIDLSAIGPWIPAEKTPFSNAGPPPAPAATTQAATAASGASAPAIAMPSTDQLTGTVGFHNANWKADYLVNHVQISQATLHLNPDGTRWDAVAFSYGPVKGTAVLNLPEYCLPTQSCLPNLQLQFGALDADVLQSAMLGAQQKGTLLSDLINRLHPATTPAWPAIDATVKADSLILGPVTLRQASATLRTDAAGAQITALDAGILGGHMSGTGLMRTAATAQDKPTYSFDGRFEKLTPQAVGALLNQHWSGGSFDANGKVELAGYTKKDLTASAKGTLHFDWHRGTVGGAASAALAKFDDWAADAEIANGSATLKQNKVQRGANSSTVQATATLGAGAKASFAVPAKNGKN